MITTTRIDAADLEKLKHLAKAHRRSMTQEIGALIDAATPLKSFDQTVGTTHAAETMAKMKPEDDTVLLFNGTDELKTYDASLNEISPKPGMITEYKNKTPYLKSQTVEAEED